MIGFKCAAGQPVLLRLVAENLALTSFDLFAVQSDGSRKFLGSDPDIDGTATFAVTAPSAGDPPFTALVLLIKPAAVGGGQVPIRLKVEQSGREVPAIQPPPIDRNGHGFLLGEGQSGVFAELRFNLFFVG